MRRAHIAGHSTGGSIAAQLALDHADKVHTLTLLEPTLVSLPLGQAFLRSAGPVFEAYRRGDQAEAFAMFVPAASGLDWEACRALLEARIQAWSPSRSRTRTPSSASSCPRYQSGRLVPSRRPRSTGSVMSVLGAETQPVWVEIAQFLRSALPNVEDCTIEGVGHLLQIHPEPVARAMADFCGGTP